MADSMGLPQSEWDQRYSLEALLMDLHRQEESYWQQRGRLSWTLKGDALTAYIFAIANGRRRRSSLFHLMVNGVSITDPTIIMSHDCEFYS